MQIRKNIFTLTRSQLMEKMREAAEEQRRHDQEVLNKAIEEQVKIDAGRDFQYFFTAALYILWRDFNFREKRLNAMIAALNKMFDTPPELEEMQKKLKECADIELLNMDLKEGK